MARANKEVVRSAAKPAAVPNPRRVAAGRANRAKRKGVTADGRERLRLAALKNQPWRFSTGPRTAAGKAKVAQNGKSRQQGPLSIKQIRAEVAGLGGLVRKMRDCR